MAAVGLVVQPSPPTGSRLTHVYLPTLSVELALAAYVAFVKVPRGSLRAWVGRTWRTPAEAAVDVVVAAGIVALVIAIEAAFHAERSAAVIAELPRTTAERTAWVMLAAGVGVSEELVYRGYLQLRLAHLTGSRIVGLLSQAALFGLAHGDQGAGPAARAALYGALFGLVRYARGSILPGAIAHVAIDLGSGLGN